MTDFEAMLKFDGAVDTARYRLNHALTHLHDARTAMRSPTTHFEAGCAMEHARQLVQEGYDMVIEALSEFRVYSNAREALDRHDDLAPEEKAP